MAIATTYQNGVPVSTQVVSTAGGGGGGDIPAGYTFPGQTPGMKSYTPSAGEQAVYTADTAQQDYSKKLADVTSQLTAIQNQANAIAQQKLVDAQKQAETEQQRIQNEANQQALDIKAKEAKAKNDALGMAGSLSGGTVPMEQAIANIQKSGLAPSEQTAAIENIRRAYSGGTMGATGQTGTTPGTTTPTKLSEQDQYRSDINAEMQTGQTMYDEFVNELNQIRNGTFPLSATEQALINSTQAAFNKAKVEQEKANTAYVGAMKMAGFRAGRTEYTPELEAGNVKMAIDQGISKITDIDAKAASAIAELQKGFDDKNYQLINAQYTAFKDLLNTKTTAIQKLHDDAYNHEKDLRDYNLELAKFDEQIKSNAVDNDYKYAQIAKMKAETEKIIAENEATSPVAVKAQKQGEMLDNLSLAQSIIDDPYLDNVVGVKTPGAMWGGFLGNLYGSNVIPVSNQLKQLQAILSLENRQKLKGSGAISDFEAITLQRASSAFSTGLGNDAARRELNKIKGAFATAAGLTATVKITDPSTGKSQVVQANREGINQAIIDGATVEYQ